MEEIKEVHIINAETSICFDVHNNVHDPNNESAYTLRSITFDGWRIGNVSMTIWQDIADFCHEQIEKIPHYDVVDGKLEKHKN